MSTENANVFNKDNLDFILKELAKEYKKAGGGKMPAEIILVGGAAVIEKYCFRYMTTDVDAVICAADAMKDAINHIGDRYRLPNGWLNSDFRKTSSYSSKLLEYSSFYKAFNQVLNVRIITGEYLIAMKLRAFRQYKNDLSDIVGILAEHKKRNDPMTFERIEKAVKNLYGSWDDFPDGAKDFIVNTLSAENYEQIYNLVRQNEKDAKEVLINFDNKYPGTLKADNAESVLKILRERKRPDNQKK